MTSTPATLPAPGAAPRAGVAARALAGLAGVAALAGAVVVTFGLALAAPLGMLVASLVARARRRPLGRLAGWGAAVAAASFAIVALGTVGAANAPPGTFAHMQQTFDSVRVASAKEQPPTPEWVEKLAPGTAAAQRRGAESSIAQSPALMYWAMAVGLVFTCALFGGIAGSLGWGATALLAYAARGRWPGARARSELRAAVDPDVGGIALHP
jgi:hypothetical protein